jgi:hypothetical protein
MEQDQQKAEKKIWVDPELTFMPMEKIKSFHAPSPQEIVNNNGGGDDDQVGGS